MILTHDDEFEALSLEFRHQDQTHRNHQSGDRLRRYFAAVLYILFYRNILSQCNCTVPVSTTQPVIDGLQNKDFITS